MTIADKKLTHAEVKEQLTAAYVHVMKEEGDGPATLTHAEVKDAMKTAFKEILDERAMAFGYFSVKWISAAIGGAILLFVLSRYGIPHG